MLRVVKLLLKVEVGVCALNCHGNYIVDHGKSWKNHGIEFFNICGNPVCLCFQSVTPDEDSILDEDSDRWNGSPQGKRLEKEWAALSQCRALKRSSEVT